MHQKTTLDNGLRLVTTHMPHTQSVSINFFIGIGSRYETDQQAGISHFIEHLNFKGTTKRETSRDISTAIEGVGGFLNGGTDKELTIYWCRVAQPHFHLALDVLTDMLLNSRYDTGDIERERQVIIEEINRSKDSPSQQVNTIIEELLWPKHPLGRDIAGSKETVTGTTRQMMLDYLESNYRPNNTVVSLAGNIDPEEAVEAVSQATAGWNNQQAQPVFTAYQENPNPRLQVEQRDTEQIHLCLALPGLSLLHPKRFALDMLNVVLGEGMSSRLFAEIRDKLGLAYSIHSYIDHFLDSGSMTVYAGVEPRRLPEAIAAILEQLALLKEPIAETELSKAKELSKGRLLLRMEDSRSIASWTGGQEILTGKIRTIEEVVDIIDAVTATEIKELAEELLVSDQLRLAVVGPVADEGSLEELLKI